MLMPGGILGLLATSFRTGGSGLDEILGCCERTLGRKWDWLVSVAQRYADKYANSTAPRHRGVVLFLKQDPALIRALAQ